MKIVHIYAKNIQVFVDAVKDTDCKLNASSDINYLLQSLDNFNARDVMGLVVFANPMTRKCVELITYFDAMFVFKKMPIIIINDQASELWAQRKFKVKNSKVFILNSEDDSISDTEINSIFTTLLAFSDSVYDLSVCSAERKLPVQSLTETSDNLKMSAQLSNILQLLEGGNIFESR